jgi:hypothetical protein
MLQKHVGPILVVGEPMPAGESAASSTATALGAARVTLAANTKPPWCAASAPISTGVVGPMERAIPSAAAFAADLGVLLSEPGPHPLWPRLVRSMPDPANIHPRAL